MTGDELRRYRGDRSQSEFADWLNGQLGARYAQRRISDWENERIAVPCEVELLFAKRRIAELEGKK